MNKTVSISLPGQSVVLTRLFAAPRALVFDCWTDPAHVANWFGPHMMAKGEVTSARAKGGAVAIIMIDPDGGRYPIEGTISVWDPPAKVSYSISLHNHPPSFHEMISTTFEEVRARRSGDPTNRAEMTAEFADHPEGTLLTLSMTFDTTIERDVHAKMGMNEGWSESFEKLDAILAAKGS